MNNFTLPQLTCLVSMIILIGIALIGARAQSRAQNGTRNIRRADPETVNTICDVDAQNELDRVLTEGPGGYLEQRANANAQAETNRVQTNEWAAAHPQPPITYSDNRSVTVQVANIGASSQPASRGDVVEGTWRAA